LYSVTNQLAKDLQKLHRSHHCAWPTVNVTHKQGDAALQVALNSNCSE